MKSLRRMPKSTNIRIEFLDEMTIESITANTFDSHSDAGSIFSEDRHSTIMPSSDPAEITKRPRADNLPAIEDVTIDDIQEVDEIVPSSKPPQCYEDLSRYTNRGRILPKLHGFPYISIVKATNVPERASLATPSTTASTLSTISTNSSIQTEGKFAVGQFSSPSTRMHAAHSANETGRTALEHRISSRRSAASTLAGGSTSSNSSEHTSSLTCGCRAALTALGKVLCPQKAAASNSTIHPLSSGHHIQPTTQVPPRRPPISIQQIHLTRNEARLTALDQGWARMGMPEFFTWLLKEFKFVRPSPGAMSWLNHVELDDTSRFHWIHWEYHVRRLVESLKEENVWIEGDEHVDVGEAVIETLESWMQEQ